MDKYYPYNAVNGDRTHDADDLAKIIQAMITDGVELVTGEMMQVTEATGFDVTVKPGTCIVQGRIGIIESNKTLSVPAPSSALDRIDIVAARADYTERMTKLVYLTGTPASTPTAPALKNDVYGYDIPLAEIRVNKNATKITQANITDRREACSFIIPKNTDAFFAQLRTAFDEWFETAKNTLDGDAAGNLLNRIQGIVTELTATELAALDTADRAALYADGARLLRVVNGDAIVLLTLDAEGGTRWAGDAPRNLVVNGNLACPVNQQGKTTYTGNDGYTIDGWRLEGASSVLVVGQGYVDYTNTTYTNMLRQDYPFPAELAGKTVTLTMDIEPVTAGATCAAYIRANKADGTYVDAKASVSAGGVALCTLDIPEDVTGIYLGMTVPVDGATGRAYWAALYIGAYTLDTLPPYVLVGYAAEAADKIRGGWTELWTGSWSSGDITVPGWSQYRILAVNMAGILSLVVRMDSGYVYALSASIFSSGAQSIRAAKIASVKDVLTYDLGSNLSHVSEGAHGKYAIPAISGIYGVIRI